MFPKNVINETEKFFDDYSESLAYIHDNSSGKKVFDKGTGVFQTECAEKKLEYDEIIKFSSHVPMLPNFEAKISTKRHRIEVGGCMDIHDDDPHGLAITTYLSDCEGGELAVRNPDDNNEYVLIKPETGVSVILKGGTMHEVLEVKSGTRISLQTFIDFFPSE